MIDSSYSMIDSSYSMIDSSYSVIDSSYSVMDLLIPSGFKCGDIIKRNLNFLLSQEAQDAVADQGRPGDRGDLLPDVSLPGLH